MAESGVKNKHGTSSGPCTITKMRYTERDMRSKEQDCNATAERMRCVVGDITTMPVEAIVNAANPKLSGGGGVDGAIHRAAGPGLMAECRALGGCCTGEAKITNGYCLSARYVIHTVGPVWHGGGHLEREFLASCYEQSLLLAELNDIHTLAFPCISTGVYGFPPELAAPIAVNTVRAFLDGHPLPQQVYFCCFSEEAARLYRPLLAAANARP